MWVLHATFAAVGAVYASTKILGYDEVKSGTNNFPSTIGAFGCVLFVFNAFLTLQTEQVAARDAKAILPQLRLFCLKINLAVSAGASVLFMFHQQAPKPSDGELSSLDSLYDALLLRHMHIDPTLSALLALGWLSGCALGIAGFITQFSTALLSMPFFHPTAVTLNVICLMHGLGLLAVIAANTTAGGHPADAPYKPGCSVPLVYAAIPNLFAFACPEIVRTALPWVNLALSMLMACLNLLFPQMLYQACSCTLPLHPLPAPSSSTQATFWTVLAVVWAVARESAKSSSSSSKDDKTVSKKKRVRVEQID